MAAPNTTDTEILCQMAIQDLVKKISTQFPQYPEFSSKYVSICAEEAFDDIAVLIDDVKDGFAESMILDTIAEAIDIQDAHKEPLCNAIHESLSTFTPSLTLNLAEIDTKVAKNEIDDMKETVETTAYFFKQQSEDLDLLKILAIGKKNRFPILTYLLDTYSRCRLLEYIKLYQELSNKETKRGYKKCLSTSFQGDVYEIHEFISNCKALKALKKRKTKQNDAQAGRALIWMDSSLKSVCRRGPTAPLLRMKAAEMIFKIDDAMLVHAKYYISALTAIHRIVHDSKSALPLQIDLWVIPKAMKHTQTEHASDHEASSEDSDMDDPASDEDDEEKELRVDPMDKRLEFTDHLVKKEDVDPAADVNALSTILYETYQNVVRGQPSKRMVMIIDRRQDDSKDKEDSDTDNEDGGDEDKDTLYGFLTKKSQNIPKNNYLHESLFNLSRIEVLPSENGKVDPVDARNNNAIHIKTNLPNMCLFSIHIHSENAIRAYWYCNGSCTRWFVRDMVDIWPLYFVGIGVKEDNGAPIYQDVKPVIELIKANAKTMPLKDDDFDRFFEENTKLKPTDTYHKTV